MNIVTLIHLWLATLLGVPLGEDAAPPPPSDTTTSAEDSETARPLFWSGIRSINNGY